MTSGFLSPSNSLRRISTYAISCDGTVREDEPLVQRGTQLCPASSTGYITVTFYEMRGRDFDVISCAGKLINGDESNARGCVYVCTVEPLLTHTPDNP